MTITTWSSIEGTGSMVREPNTEVRHEVQDMLNSAEIVRPYQVASTHSWGASENSDKPIEGVTALIPDRAIFPKCFAALPVVTYQADEIVIAEGSRTGRLLILGKGSVVIVKEDTEIAQVTE